MGYSEKTRSSFYDDRRTYSPLTLRGGLCSEDIKCAICFQIVFCVNHFLLNFLNIFFGSIVLKF